MYNVEMESYLNDQRRRHRESSSNHELQMRRHLHALEPRQPRHANRVFALLHAIWRLRHLRVRIAFENTQSVASNS